MLEQGRRGVRMGEERCSSNRLAEKVWSYM